MWFKQVSFYPISKEKLPDFEYLSNKLAQSGLNPHVVGRFFRVFNEVEAQLINAS